MNEQALKSMPKKGIVSKYLGKPELFLDETPKYADEPLHENDRRTAKTPFYLSL